MTFLESLMNFGLEWPIPVLIGAEMAALYCLQGSMDF